jgi:hypothetical protein
MHLILHANLTFYIQFAWIDWGAWPNSQKIAAINGFSIAEGQFPFLEGPTAFA